MSGFDLPNSYTDNSEALLRMNKSHTTSSSTTPWAVEPVTPVPSATTEMAKSLQDYSTPTVANVPVGPIVNMGTRNFELCTGLITMVQANQLCGLPSEDASAHLQHFLELCDTIVIKDVAPAASGSVCFPSPSWGRRNNGFTRKRKQSTRGTNVLRRSSRSFFP